MLKSSSNRNSSLENSNSFNGKLNQKHRRSSFVQNLIFQYKNQSHRKTSNKVDIISQQKNSCKTFNQTKNSQPSSKQNNFKIQKKEKQDNAQRLNQNCQQIHFPLKEVNFLQKYKSTELRKNFQSSKKVPGIGSIGKKYERGNLNIDFESEYESQFLKTMFSCHNHVRNNVKQDSINVKQKNKRQTSSKNSDVNNSLNQHIMNKKTDHKLKVSEQIFLKQFEQCINFILSKKYQEGLNLLLKMRNDLKEFPSMNQCSADNMIEIARRQFLTLCLYKINLNLLKQQFSLPDHQKLMDKITKKYDYLSNSMKNEDSKDQINICFIIIKLIQTSKLVDMVRNSPHRNNIQIQVAKQKGKQLLTFCKNIFIKVQTQNKQKNSLQLIIKTFIEFISNFIDSPLAFSSESIQSSFTLQHIKQICIHSSNAIMLYKNFLFDHFHLSTVKLSQNYLGKLFNILLMNTIVQTETIIQSHINQIYCKSNNFHKSIKILQNFNSLFLKQQIQRLSIQNHTILQMNHNQDQSFKTQMNANSFWQHFKQICRNRIQQTILIKIFFQINSKLPVQNHQIQNCKTKDYQQKIKQQIVSCLQEQFDKLKNQKSKLSLVYQTNTQSNQQFLQQTSRLWTVLTFPKLFIQYHSTLNDVSSFNSILSSQKQSIYLHKKIQSLQDLKRMISQFKQHYKFNQGQQNKSFSSCKLQSETQRQVEVSQKYIISEVKELEQWTNSQLTMIYYEIGEISNSRQLILENFKTMKHPIFTHDELQNKYSNNFSKQKQQQLKKYYSCQTLLTQDKEKSRVFNLYASWKVMLLGSELNLLIERHQQYSHNSELLTLISQIYLNLFYHELGRISKTKSDCSKALYHIYQDIFQEKFNTQIIDNSQKKHEYLQKIIKIIQIHVLIALITHQSKSQKNQNYSQILNTFNDDDQLDEYMNQNVLYLNSEKKNNWMNQSLSSRKIELFNQQNVELMQQHSSKMQSYHKEMRKTIEKLKKPTQFYVKSLKTYFSEKIQSEDFGQDELQKSFQIAFAELRSQFEIIMNLN